MKIHILFALFAVLTITAKAQDANAVEAFISPDCERPRLMLPLGISRDSVTSSFAEMGMTPTTSTSMIDAYAYPSEEMICSFTYRDNRVTGIIVYLRYETMDQASTMAEVVNEQIARTHGEADPKTHYHYRQCGKKTYALKATNAKLVTGYYLVLTLMTVR